MGGTNHNIKVDTPIVSFLHPEKTGRLNDFMDSYVILNDLIPDTAFVSWSDMHPKRDVRQMKLT